MAIVKAVCISEHKGTQKEPVSEITLREEWGVEHDAHAGAWHRQVSLLSAESVEAFKAQGAPVHDGSFGENIVVEGIDFKRLPVGTRYTVGSDGVVLEQTQVGKHCHSRCEIYHIMGDCIMPREGVFARVLHGGVVRPGDHIAIEFVPSMMEEAAAALDIAEMFPEAIAAERAAKRRDEEHAKRMAERAEARTASEQGAADKKTVDEQDAAIKKAAQVGKGA